MTPCSSSVPAVSACRRYAWPWQRKLVCVGLFGGVVPVMPATLPLRAVSITGSYVGSLTEMAEVMALARRGDLPLLPLTTRPLAEVNDAMAALRSGAIRGRTVLQP